jgi:Zn-dependent M28 family amino/carboxypeptidase
MKKMSHAGMALATAAVLTACGNPGQHETPVPQEAAAISPEGILEDVTALSADDMAGRATGTPGGEKAAAYIEKRFREIGLAPIEGSYRQEVSLVGYKKMPESSTLSMSNAAGALDLSDGGNVSFWSTSQRPVVEVESAELLFVGYGVEAPEYEWDDFKGAQLEGKVLLFLNDDPPVSQDGQELFGGEARTYYGRWPYKYEQAMKHGAAGAFVIHTTASASYPFSVVQRSGSEEHFALALDGAGYQVDLLGWLDEATSEQIAQAMDTTVAGLFEEAAQRSFAPRATGFRVSAHIETEIRDLTTSNIYGILPGSDEGLSQQALVFSAHYDHLGTDPNVEGDQVFNGAWDNGAGTAAILNLAQAFAADPQRPRRSLLFLACAAEENGSLGSQWFVQKPPFERARLVGNMNIDMPQIFGITKDIAVIGGDTNSLGEALSLVASVHGVRVTGDPRPRAGIFYRSDQVNFAKAGIPALFVLPGSDFVEPVSFDIRQYREDHYHQASDEIREEWDLSGVARDMQLVYEAAVAIANSDELPRWVEGNEFEEEWKELHGK